MGFVVIVAVVVVVVAVLSSPLSLSLSITTTSTATALFGTSAITIHYCFTSFSLSLSGFFSLSATINQNTTAIISSCLFYTREKAKQRLIEKDRERERESVSDFFIYRHRKVLHFLLFFCLWLFVLVSEFTGHLGKSFTKKPRFSTILLKLPLHSSPKFFFYAMLCFYFYFFSLVL